MKSIIEELYKMGATLMGAGYDNALLFLSKLIDLEIIEIPSGTQLETWTVPDEWVVREAWVKYKSKKILDYTKQPLSLVVYSEPFKGKLSKEEFLNHLYFSADQPTKTPYIFKFYERDWGFTMPANERKKLKDGDYEIFIDTEFKPGTMKLGVHTIPGKTDREILLFAHLDHPYQANDNLSGVACLVDLVPKLKDLDHTIKIIFCPETIGSIAYGVTQDISKVDFVIAVDICGNDNTLLIQKAFDKEARINRVAHIAVRSVGESYNKGEFRATIGSDEYYFNDPKVGIPGIMFSRWPYDEYHTTDDTPDKIHYPSIEKTQQVILKTIQIYEQDFIPVKNFKGPLMRSKYRAQTGYSNLNRCYDMLFYSMDGKRSLAELCAEVGLEFEHTYKLIKELEDDKQVSRADFS